MKNLLKLEELGHYLIWPFGHGSFEHALRLDWKERLNGRIKLCANEQSLYENEQFTHPQSKHNKLVIKRLTAVVSFMLPSF